MTDPELPEAKFIQSFFAFFDHRQALRRNLDPVGDSRREAGRSGTVPHRQAGAAGQFANIGLGKTRVEQRREHLVRPGGTLAGPPVPLVVDIDPVSYSGVAEALR